MAAHIPILTFHHIGENGYPPALFVGLLRRLHRLGYQTLDLVAATDLCKTGGPIPEKSIVLTFDDGYLSALTIAAPLLHSLGFVATLFPFALAKTARRASFEGTELLQMREIEELCQLGFSVGSHTLNHLDMTTLSKAEVEHQLNESKNQLQQQLGRAINSFAYPYGRFNSTVKAAVQQRYCCACGTKLALTDCDTDRYELNRIDMALFNRPALASLLTQPILPTYLWARRKLLTAQQTKV